MSRKTILLIFLVLFSQVGSLSAQVREAWVARYDGPANLDDKGKAIAVDGNGNVYVAGESCLQADAETGICLASEYVTLKYGPAGSPLWVARYQGPGNGADTATALAVDGDGNVYVTGASLGTDTLFDYVTIKYDTNGAQLWLARYNGEASGNDRATALALDADGNVYVTGESAGVGSDLDYTTIKYAPDGTQLWVARYDGPGGGLDSAMALFVDANRNVYVTGYSTGAGGQMEYATLKYGPSGSPLWVARYGGPGSNDNFAAALTVDASGNVYVTGQSLGTISDYATVKYDASGNQRWAALFHQIPFTEDAGTAIAVDDGGNVYVTGKSWGPSYETNNDIVTLKYDPAGNRLWMASYDGPYHCHDIPVAIRLDGRGGVYVVGYGRGVGTSYDYETLKYSAAAGTELWAARFDGPAHNRDYGAAMALDANGNVYVTGWSRGTPTDYDIATIKYSQP